MSHLRLYALIAVLIVIVGAIYFIDSKGVKRTSSDEIVTVTPRTLPKSDSTITIPTPIKKEDLVVNKPLSIPEKSMPEKSRLYELAKEITSPDGFINTNEKPITINELIGKKVILVDFWTYSCINCQRTTPYLNAWYEKYKDGGLVIIGIHTPEFEFEKDYNNVKTAVEKFGIKFPVVLDNDYSTWTAYKNRYWPRKYLIDIDGYIVYDHIGEGAYEETEKKIQEALKERMVVLEESGTISQSLTKEVPIQSGSKSPETYFGASRSSNIIGEQKNLTIPSPINLNTLYLSGDWNITNEFAQNNSSNSKIVYKYTAQDVFFVSQADAETIVEVLIDGKPLGAEAGTDIIKTSDGKSIVKIKEARLYKIIQGSQSETHTLELIIQNPGLKAFTFTFG